MAILISFLQEITKELINYGVFLKNMIIIQNNDEMFGNIFERYR